MRADDANTRTGAVHARLRSDILGGLLQPGQRLKFAELCERYGASVSAVREALTRLVEQGLVTSQPRIGFRVVPLSLDDLNDLTATRIDIEGLALRYATKRGGVGWEANLVAAHHTLERTPYLDDRIPPRVSDGWESAHVAFHAALIDGCGSTRLRYMAYTLRDAAELYRRWSQPHDPDRNVPAEHRRLLDAALARDASEVTAALTAHLERTTQGLREACALASDDESA
jgi:DNA-binding GntR family transcriptional regulator